MKQVYWKTMRFQLMKLLPGLLSIVIAGLLFLPITYWCNHGLEGSGRGAVLLLWAVIAGLIYYFVVHYYGYLFQTAFLAAVAEIAVNQALPSSYQDFIREHVKGQFAKPENYRYLHRLVSRSMCDLHQSSLWKNKILLNYLSVCCVCINFYKKKAGRYKSIADAVVMYAKNQKKLLASGLKTGLLVCGSVAAAVLLFWLLYSLIPVLGWFSALVFGLLTAGMLKYAFLDSWFLTKELLVFGQVEQMPADGVYEELSASSRSFRKLYHKMRREQSSLDAKERPSEFDFHSLKFCGECGALVANELDDSVKEEPYENVVEQTDQKADQGQSQATEAVGQKVDQADPESKEDEGMEKLPQSVQGVEASAGMEGDQTDGKESAVQGNSEDNGWTLPQDHSSYSDYSEDSSENWETVEENHTGTEQKVVFCGECGAAIFPGETFCGECGTPAERKETKEETFCGECGSPLSPGEKFCGECGTPVNRG